MIPATFSPTWISPPGETIRDILSSRGWSNDRFASEMNVARENADGLLSGFTCIEEEIANRLSLLFGGSPNFWLQREHQYRQAKHELVSRIDIEEVSQWMDGLPASELRNCGWLGKRTTAEEKLAQTMSFLGVGSEAEWKKKYKAVFSSTALLTSASFKSKPIADAFWLRLGEIKASQLSLSSWCSEKLQDLLPQCKKLTRESNPQVFIPRLMEFCAEAGLACVVVKAPKGCRASGAARFQSEGYPIVQLSARHLSDDHFWFTFFHEIGHILLHGIGDRIDFECDDRAKEEREANQFAAEQLVPKQFVEELLTLQPLSVNRIARFAKKVGVSAGLIVGQLQNAGRIPHGHSSNRLKRRYMWQGQVLLTKRGKG